MNEFDERVDTVVKWFNLSPVVEQDQFKNTSRDKLVRYHHSLGRNIRNHFKLWEVEHEPEIIDGVDHSENHPDQISMKIIEAVWDKVKK